jgi:nucleoside diphosphate kinase
VFNLSHSLNKGVLDMAKNNMVKKYKEELEDDFDFSEESPGDEMVAGMMSGLIEASNHQTLMAIELTKLIVSKSAEQSMSEDSIFSTFKRASKVISENLPLKGLWEKFG